MITLNEMGISKKKMEKCIQNLNEYLRILRYGNKSEVRQWGTSKKVMYSVDVVDRILESLKRKRASDYVLVRAQFRAIRNVTMDVMDAIENDELDKEFARGSFRSLDIFMNAVNTVVVSWLGQDTAKNINPFESSVRMAKDDIRFLNDKYRKKKHAKVKRSILAKYPSFNATISQMVDIPYWMHEGYVVLPDQKIIVLNTKMVNDVRSYIHNMLTVKMADRKLVQFGKLTYVEKVAYAWVLPEKTIMRLPKVDLWIPFK